MPDVGHIYIHLTTKKTHAESLIFCSLSQNKLHSDPTS